MIDKVYYRFRKIPKLSFLLIGIIFFIFVFPLFENSYLQETLVTISYTVMLLSVSSIVKFENKWMLSFIIISVILQWVLFFSGDTNFPIIRYVAFLFTLSIFTIASYTMVSQIISSKRVDSKLILETITGYLLIGIIFTLVNVLLIDTNTEAISFSSSQASLGEIIYYSFVTFTTIGYGDISPISQAARGFAILFSLIGQLYLTIIIAFIIGKYLNSKN